MAAIFTVIFLGIIGYTLPIIIKNFSTNRLNEVKVQAVKDLHRQLVLISTLRSSKDCWIKDVPDSSILNWTDLKIYSDNTCSSFQKLWEVGKNIGYLKLEKIQWKFNSLVNGFREGKLVLSVSSSASPNLTKTIELDLVARVVSAKFVSLKLKKAPDGGGVCRSFAQNASSPFTISCPSECFPFVTQTINSGLSNKFFRGLCLRL